MEGVLDIAVGPGSLPCVGDGGGYMVGDRPHFHLLQLHNRTTVLNGGHDYHIAGEWGPSNPIS